MNDRNDLVQVQDDAPGTQLVVDANGDPFVTMVERLATNDRVDADKLEKLVDIQIRIMDRNAEAEFNTAMSKVQSELPTVAADALNTQTSSMYAKHEAISKAIKPIYTRHGFSTSFSQADTDRADHIRVRGVLRHNAGHAEEYFADLPIDDKGIKGNTNKTPLHAAGSTFTYGRRYLTCLMFDVATGDDNDGNVYDSGAISEEQQNQLHALATELFGQAANDVLRSLARRRFHFENGDWTQIPAHRLPDAERSLREKAAESPQGVD